MSGPCTIAADHCSTCGSTADEHVGMGWAYPWSTCCNDAVSFGPDECQGRHNGVEPKPEGYRS